MDDLFSALDPAPARRTPDEPRVFTVTELTRDVRELLEREVGQVWVQGEVCNYRRQSSGHQYFGLKDDRCQIQCVLFQRPHLQLRQLPLEDGMAVQARGQMTVYEARGQYQLSVTLMQAAGVGLLQAKFEALKRKLAGEGLFDPARKVELPKFPRVLGIVTSPTGAALRDMLNILARRAPWVRVIVNPVRVQGSGAASEIAAAIGEFNQHERNSLPRVDIIVAARGGGSAEDLWAFNEEVVARAIFVSEIPVVSAVGHEIDFTIADFVADLRAPTPSAAAELIVPDAVELERQLGQTRGRLQRCLTTVLEQARARLTFFARGALMREPRQRLAQHTQRVDLLGESLTRALRTRCEAARVRLQNLESALGQHRPDRVFELRRQQLATVARRLTDHARSALAEYRHPLKRLENALRLLSPEATLERGYSITTDGAGKLIVESTQAVPGMKIRTRVRDGAFESVVQAEKPRAKTRNSKLDGHSRRGA